MPGANVPSRIGLPSDLAAMSRRIEALETFVRQLGQQALVFTDPTGASGDPAHAHAVVVIGALDAITAISGYGIASFKTGSWIQL